MDLLLICHRIHRGVRICHICKPDEAEAAAAVRVPVLHNDL
jgi:hypothetical protein